MAKKATYNGPWDRYELTGESDEEKVVFEKGVPVKVTNENASRLEALNQNILVEEYNEDEDGKGSFNEPLVDLFDFANTEEAMTDANSDTGSVEGVTEPSPTTTTSRTRKGKSQ